MIFLMFRLLYCKECYHMEWVIVFKLQGNIRDTFEEMIIIQFYLVS